MISYLLVVNPGNAVLLGTVIKAVHCQLLRIVWSSPECRGSQLNSNLQIESKVSLLYEK